MSTHILLCDDEGDSYDLVLSAIEVLRQWVAELDVTITWARTVAEAEEQIRQIDRWRAVLCDISFANEPGGGHRPHLTRAGVALVGEAHRQRRGKGASVLLLVLTQYATDQGVHTAARGAGADDVLSKSLRRTALARALGKKMGVLREDSGVPGPGMAFQRLVARLVGPRAGERQGRVGHVGLPQPG